MNLLNKFDQAVKDLSTDQQWIKYKAMVKQPTLAELDKRYIEETIKTEWQKPRVITVNEDRPMKYKVDTTLLASHDKGDRISEGVHRNLTLAGCPESWFQPIEQVEGGDWVIAESLIAPRDQGKKRIGRVVDISAGKYHVDYAIVHESDFVGSHVYSEIYRKATTDEIESELIKEAKRRFKGKIVQSIGGHNSNVTGELDFEVEHWNVIYHDHVDRLWFRKKGDKHSGICVYDSGDWATVVDQTPDIEINGYKAEFHDDYVQFGCAKISKALICDFYREYKYAEWGKLANKCNRSINGVKIGEGVFTIDQIKQIASYYEKQ